MPQFIININQSFKRTAASYKNQSGKLLPLH